MRLEPTEDQLVDLAAHPKVIAIGETGLDYYWHKDARNGSGCGSVPIFVPRRAGLPLVIHTREAALDTLRLMAEEGQAKSAASCTALPRPGKWRRRHLIWLSHLFLGNPHLQERPANQGGGEEGASTACWSRPTPPTWPL